MSIRKYLILSIIARLSIKLSINVDQLKSSGMKENPPRSTYLFLLTKEIAWHGNKGMRALTNTK